MVLQTRDRDSTEAYVQALARYLDDDEAIYRLHSQLRKRSLFSVISKRDMSAAMIWKQELDQVNSKISGILTQFEEEKSHEWAIHHLLVSSRYCPPSKPPDFPSVPSLIAFYPPKTIERHWTRWWHNPYEVGHCRGLPCLRL